MLDRAVVEEFLDCQFEDIELEVPAHISREQIVEAFCQYVEDDYYEWLKDNFKSFFNQGNPDWEWIRGRVKAAAVEHK
ncbi:MAG: hypothetical protein ACETVW_01690 [Dehalococcoidia bacterium]